MENVSIAKQGDQSSLDLKKWKESLQLHKEIYQTDTPYPHIVIDNFLNESVARKAMDSFPKVQDEGWIHYVHVNEKKHGLNKFDLLPPYIQKLIKELNTAEFVSYLSELQASLSSFLMIHWKVVDCIKADAEDF